MERISETTSWRMSKCVICHSVFKAICYSGSVLVVALLVYLNSCSCPVVKIRYFLRMKLEFQWPHTFFSWEWRINSYNRNAECGFKKVFEVRFRYLNAISHYKALKSLRLFRSDIHNNRKSSFICQKMRAINVLRK